MTIYGQYVRGFKREKNECIRKGENCSFFLIGHVWCYDAYFVTYYVIMTYFIAALSFLRCEYIHRFRIKNLLNFDHIWSCGGRFEFL